MGHCILLSYSIMVDHKWFPGSKICPETNFRILYTRNLIFQVIARIFWDGNFLAGLSYGIALGIDYTAAYLKSSKNDISGGDFAYRV
jgi:hypothetical protein